MLSDIIRKDLRKKLTENPKAAVREIEKDPQILKMLLDSDGEKIKYIKMNEELQNMLQKKANDLNTTQGWLLGAGILLLLSLMSSDR